MQQNKSFLGAVIYIDLRGYTKIVEEKVLENIAQLIYNYQEVITQKINNLYTDEDIAIIEYMGDGVMIIIKQQELEVTNTDMFAHNIYQNATTIKNSVLKILKLEKEKYTDLDSIDFGMAVSLSKIYQKNITTNRNQQRKMFFGVSLNRATKIGNAMDAKKNHIGIDKKMYDDYLVNTLHKYNMVKGTKPIVHMYSENITKPSGERKASLK
ncbi:hypothetical protein [Sulfurovum sp.]|uniref:hypothetical protein n=1 Tax=Sulfurovum sp. TaxID=1969726 RepID=UPI0035678206